MERSGMINSLAGPISLACSVQKADSCDLARGRLRARNAIANSRDRTTVGTETMKPRTIIEKIWDNHIVTERAGSPALIYIDLHLVHEVTSPQAFDGLRRR